MSCRAQRTTPGATLASGLIVTAALLALSAPGNASADTYGLSGPLPVAVDSIDGVTHRQGKTYLYRPADTVPARRPVVFFLCGLGPNTPR